MTPLNAVALPHCQVVPQKIKAKFAVGAVSNIGSICFPPFHQPQLILIFKGGTFFQVHQEGFQSIFCPGCHLQHTHRKTKSVVDACHPARIPACQVIIHCHKVNPAPCQRVEIDRQGCHEGFSFTGPHFCNLSIVQGHPAN